MSVTMSLVSAFLASVALAALHLAAPRIRALPLVPEKRMASFAGGLAVSYVFLHLLPEIATGNEGVGEALDDIIEPSPLTELAIFGVALLGFVAFYGLERLAAARSGTEEAGARPAPAGRVAPAGLGDLGGGGADQHPDRLGADGPARRSDPAPRGQGGDPLRAAGQLHLVPHGVTFYAVLLGVITALE